MVNITQLISFMNVSINAIGIAVPPYKADQSDIINFMTRHVGQDRRIARKIRALISLSGIESRYSVIPDFGSEEGAYEFFPKNQSLEPFPTTSQRMSTYQQHAASLALEAVESCVQKAAADKSEITHLITVSCTGMYAPGLDIELVDKGGLSTSVERTAINFMGCYAAFNALKVANSIIKADEHANVLLVSVELCSLHFQKDTNDDALLSNALFGDGAAAVLMSRSSSTKPSLAFKSFHNDLALQGKTEMGWFIKDMGFEMKLSGEVPEIIRNGIQRLTNGLLAKLQLEVSQIDYFAIHPGGRKILEVIEESLSLDPLQNQPAHQIMADFGNMSSPTVLFVINKILENLKPEDRGKKMLSFAFGPGLTMESMLLEVA